METIPLDFTANYKRFTRTKAGRPELAEIPEFSFLMIEGQGSPDDIAFATAIETLYGVAYTIKFALKRAGFGPVFAVPPLEGVYDLEDLTGRFRPEDRDHLIWTLMIAQPPHVTSDHLDAARIEIARKKSGETAHLVRLQSLTEGLCVQALHIGPYATEAVTADLIHAHMATNGLTMRGRHHEIYLSDPRRAAPEKLKTILRWPVSRIG